MADGYRIEAGHIWMFARALGDENQIYYDADYAGGTSVGSIIAPPTFIQTRAHFGRRPGAAPARAAAAAAGAAPAAGAPAAPAAPAAAPRAQAGPGGTGLHAEQHYEYHRPLRPGDVLSATTQPGKSWEKEGRRAGKLVFNESVTEFRNQDGELIMTARNVGVRTERPVERG